MRFGGLGQLWATLIKLISLMFLCQLLSPLVALLAIAVSGIETNETEVIMPTILSSDTPTQSSISIDKQTDTSFDSSIEGNSECCHDSSESTHVSMCPIDHILSPHLCTDPTVQCSNLPLSCMKCKCDYNCVYGSTSEANCSVDSKVQCIGERNFKREYRCSYCFLTEDYLHKCSNRDIGCKSVGSPSSKSHWYIANCSIEAGTICLGKHVFNKRRECNWTEGYSRKTALLLSVTLGGFGADRFYLGHWQEGIGKLFSFGGLGVWTLVDVVLVATGYIGPADGSLYI